MTLAYSELQRVRNLSAFNVSGYKTRKRLNQHATQYIFPDSSVLKIYKSGRGQTWTNEFGICDCVSLIRTNKQSENLI